jgi:butyryl-CoA dehydrogenase
MGFIEETGIAQQYRDVRITAIYEGTTGIQALDLVGRKVIRDTGKTANALIAKLKAFAAELATVEDADVKAIHAELVRGVDALATTSQAIGVSAMDDLRLAVACSVPYLKLWGIVAGGWQMARAAQIAAAKIAARDADSDFYKAKLATARFYADHVLTQARWLQAEIQHGAPSVMALTEEQFELDRKSAVTV